MMFVKYLNGEFEEEVRYISLEIRREIWDGNIFFGVVVYKWYLRLWYWRELSRKGMWIEIIRG